LPPEKSPSVDNLPANTAPASGRPGGADFYRQIVGRRETFLGGAILTVFRKKHPLTFLFISPRKMFRFPQFFPKNLGESNYPTDKKLNIFATGDVMLTS